MLVSQKISPVPCFFLAPNRQNEYGVYLLFVSIQCHVAVSATADHELPEIGREDPADQWVLLEHIDCADDLTDPRSRIVNLVREEVIQNAIEVARQSGSELDLRHAYRARRRGLGRTARIPELRRCRYRRISDQATVFPDRTMPA